MTAAPGNHHTRMQRVLDYIDQNLETDLTVDILSGIAAYSTYHFHRQFTATFGLTVHRYIQLARMKRASYRLAYRDAESVTDIAMDTGYDAADAFSRAFRQRFGQSPSSFQKSPAWDLWLAAFGPLDKARDKRMHRSFSPNDMAIRAIPSTPVAIMQHRGDPSTLGATIQRFIAWRRKAGLLPGTHPTFNIFRSEPCPASPADFSIDLCVGTDQPIDPHGEQIVSGEIPGGRCAVLRIIGNTENLAPAALYLYRHWLPTSGEETRDFPIYCQRLRFFPEVAEHEAVADLFLPLA